MSDLREDLHSAAMDAYWNDPEFHARVSIILRTLDLEGQDRMLVIYAIYIDSVIRFKATSDKVGAIFDVPNLVNVPSRAGAHADMLRNRVLAHLEPPQWHAQVAKELLQPTGLLDKNLAESMRDLMTTPEPEVGTEHAAQHNAAGLEPHDHLHGHGDGQHSHEGWVPDRVQARMRRDGWCAYQVGPSYCMTRQPCPEHPEAT